jgi:hypothetical protein
MPVNKTKSPFAPLATYTRGPLATYTRGTASHGYPRQTQFPTSHVYPYYLEKLSIYERGSLGEGGPAPRPGRWTPLRGRGAFPIQGAKWRATVALEASPPWGGARKTHPRAALPPLPMARHGAARPKASSCGMAAGQERHHWNTRMGHLERKRQRVRSTAVATLKWSI